MSDDRLVDVERRDGYAVLALNRPDKMNAVSLALADQFVAALHELQNYSAIVLTGNGRAFCAGVDLKERSAQGSSWKSSLGVNRAQYWAETVEVMRRHPAVFVAAVNGFALGGGLTLVNNCELAIASDTAQFGMPELGFGSFPALAGPTTVRRILPKHVAEMVFLTDRIDAAKAHAWGLINEVVAPDDVVPRACEIAKRIAGLDAVATAYTKRGIRQVEEMGWVEGIEHGALVSGSIKTARAADSVAAGGS